MKASNEIAHEEEQKKYKALVRARRGEYLNKDILIAEQKNFE